MKKFIAVGAFTAALILTGCGKNQPAPSPQCTTVTGTVAPEWVCNPNMEGGLTAVGKAPYSPLQREEAMADARDQLARQIEVRVKNMFKRFTQTTGIGKDMTVDKAVQSVSKQLAHATLRGSKMLKMWYDPKNRDLYVLVGMPDTKQIQEEAKQAVKTSFRNNQALWQQFLAKKADKELDEAIKEEFGGANAQ